MVPMANIMEDNGETSDEKISGISAETTSDSSDEIVVEEIEGFQSTRASDFVPPEKDITPVSGLNKRKDFTPPDETVDIEGIEQHPDEPLGEFPMDELENLLGISKETDSSEKTATPQSIKTTAPPKDIATATTAEIFAAQGMTDKAIQIYEKLLAKSDISDEDRQKFLARMKILKTRTDK